MKKLIILFLFLAPFLVKAQRASSNANTVKIAVNSPITGQGTTASPLAADTAILATQSDVDHLSVKTVIHDSLANISIVGGSGGSVTVDWTTGNMQIVTLDNNIGSWVMTNPIGRATLHLVLAHNNSATDFTIAWPTNVIFPGGTAPTSYGTTANGTFLISFSYYGGYYHASPVSAQYAH